MLDFWKNIKFTWKYAKEYKKKIILFVICSLLQVMISVILPIVSAKIIVSLTDDQLMQVLILAFVLFLLNCVNNVIRYLSRYFSQVVYREIFSKLQYDLGNSILKLTDSCLDNHSSGVFIQRLSSDASNIADIINLLNYELSDVLTNIGIFGAVFIIDIRIFFVLLFMVGIVAVIEKRKIDIRNQKDKEFREKQEKVSGFVGELVRGVRDIKMLYAQKSFLKELRVRFIDLNKKRYEMGRVYRNYSFVSNFFKDFFNFLIISFLIYYIYVNEITIPTALIVYNYMSKVFYVVYSYSYLLEGIKDFNLSSSRINEILDGDNFPKEKFGKRSLSDIEGNITFRNVSFGYQEDKMILNDLSFHIKAHSTVAIVGKSGAGKTTIFHLLSKMYNPISGVIQLDGVDISELNQKSIRSHITVISQNPYIFNVSIRDNLRFVSDDFSEEKMKEACHLACLDEFIQALPERYDTVVGEGGVQLSGGQRQRLAIARALVQKSDIILFDEATSALDNITQTRIQEAIQHLQKKHTIVIIAHRLSTIVDCDQILFLENGKIAAKGSHNELLKNCPSYKELYDAEIEK